MDQGSFTITLRGARVGREEFRIRRTPASDTSVNYVASATVTLGGRRLAPDLRTDTNGGLLAYRVDARGEGRSDERLKGAVERGLFTAVLTSPRGEAAREYVVSDGAVILDDDVFHQYYFVARHAGRDTLAVVVPRRSVQVAMRLERRGGELVTIGGRAVPATHLVLTDPAGAARDVWADADGRVLKVSLGVRGLVAERDEPPR